LPGYRNPLLKPITIESNLGESVCLSRYAICDDWAKEGHCEIPVMQKFMHNNCYRSCSGCVRLMDNPIDGGWTHWSQVSSCSTECGGGYTTFYRFCTIPPVMFRGKPCSGERIRRRRCNTRKC
jgi:Thrombospondin type 1 domain./ShK domain-like.